MPVINRIGKNPFKKDHILIGVGTRKDKEGLELLYLNEETLRLHTMILGATGSGKTVLLSTIVNQAIMQGWGLALADMKFDAGLFNSAYATAYHCGREKDFRFINPTAIDAGVGLLGGIGSNSYNPLMSIDSAITLTAALNQAASKGEKGGEAFWQDVKEEILDTLVRAFLSTGKPFSFKDMWIALEAKEALIKLMAECQDPEAIVVLRDWLSKLESKDTKVQGMHTQYIQGAKMFFRTFGTGTLGSLLNTYQPDVSLKQAYNTNQIVWVVLPSLLIANTASSVGNLILSDLRYLSGLIQSTTTNRKPFLVVVDEFENFAFPGVTDIFDKGRAAGIMMVIAFQSPKQIDKEAGKETRDIISSCTRTKIVLAQEDIEVATPIAELMGVEEHMMSMSMGDMSIRENNNYEISPTALCRFRDFEIALKRKDETFHGHVLAVPSNFEPGVDMPRPRFTPNLSRENGIRLFEEVAGE